MLYPVNTVIGESSPRAMEIRCAPVGENVIWEQLDDLVRF